MKYVIGFYEHGQLKFIRLYANGATWVTRLHGKTATPFASYELAMAYAKQIGIVSPDIRTI